MSTWLSSSGIPGMINDISPPSSKPGVVMTDDSFTYFYSANLATLYDNITLPTGLNFRSAYVPNDENYQFAYVTEFAANGKIQRVDLNAKALTNDSTWPLSNVCNDTTGVKTYDIIANTTHFFISCYSGGYSYIKSIPRSNPTAAPTLLVTVLDYSGPLALDSSGRLYYSGWTNGIIWRYYTLTNVSEQFAVFSPRTAWVPKVYMELSGQEVVYVAQYTVSSPCITRHSINNGSQLDPALNASCIGGCPVSFYMLPASSNGAYPLQTPIFSITPSTVGPSTPSSPSPSGSPSTSSAPSGSSPPAPKSPSGSSPSAPKSPSTPNSASFLLPTIWMIVASLVVVALF